MNKHVAASDFVGAEALKLVAVPAPGDTATYFKLAEIQRSAHALNLSVIKYQAIPAHPENAEYRQRALERVEREIADMREALANV